MNDLQKAQMGKRIMSGLFDGILLATLAVGIAVLLSFCMGYDAQLERYTAILDGYEQQYGIDLQIPTEEYEKLPANEKAAYDEAYAAIGEALQQDTAYTTLYAKMLNMRMIILSFSLLAAVLVIELLFPLILGNGQTLGKKIFGIGIMHIEGIRITPVQVFVRAVLGKFTIELMLPVYILLLTFGGGLGIVGIALLAALLIAQIVCLVITRTNAPIHDIFASTVAVDFASQRIFEDREDRDNYIKAIHAERAARADY